MSKESFVPVVVTRGFEFEGRHYAEGQKCVFSLKDAEVLIGKHAVAKEMFFIDGRMQADALSRRVAE